ncbi:MAG: hypothetical protein IJ662_04525 [Clostridia bacterium]|nr:hypothetical protein [Clostridia bacterium]
MEALQAVIEARKLLENITPLKTDCGRYCGGACCQSDEDGQGGMLLFPEEEKLYTPLPAGFALTQDDAVLPGAWLLTCDGACNRADRPLSCRLFPLLPTAKGCRMDRRGWAVCPLMDHGKAGLNPAFTAAVIQAGRLLYDCPEHAAFLSAIHAYNERLKQF